MSNLRDWIVALDERMHYRLAWRGSAGKSNRWIPWSLMCWIRNRVAS